MFDSHAHYDDKQFDIDRSTLIPELKSLGVTGIVNIGCDFETSERSVEIAEKYDFIYAAVGFHPHEAQNAPESFTDKLKEMLKHPKVKAIGEIGLDYHYDFSPRDVQKNVFVKQMELARETGMPVIIHDREAHGDTLEIINMFPRVKGVLHSFSGSFEMAEYLVRRGWYISYSGSVTYKTAENLRHSVLAVPPDRIMCETDSPYLSPVPERGKRNDSYRMRHTIQMLADIYGLSFEEMSNFCENNAKRLFNIIN